MSKEKSKRDFPIRGDKNCPCSWQRVGVTAERFCWEAWEGDPGASPTEMGSPGEGQQTLQRPHHLVEASQVLRGFCPPWVPPTLFAGGNRPPGGSHLAGPGPPRCVHCCGSAGSRGGWAGAMSTAVLQMHEDVLMGGGIERRGQSPESEVRPAVHSGLCTSLPLCQ